jgi:hypothetical protein
MKRTILSALLLVCVVTASAGRPGSNLAGKNGSGRTMTPTTSGDFTIFDVNRVRTFIRNNGSFDRDPGTGNAGYEWPRGTGKTAIYASGLWLGGKSNADGIVRVAVAEYSYEFNAGIMLPGGGWADPNDSRYRMYNIRRGDTYGSNPDYAAWPGDDGAPYVDVNGNGSFDPPQPNGTGDQPLVMGDMTVWSVFNEADPGWHVNMNAPPLGVEVQMTAFAFNRTDALGDVIFYAWKIINKGGRNLDSTYVTVWSDVDLGDSGDDYDGCDTTLGLGFTYNGDPVDGVYGIPPAVGFDFLQGPLVNGAPTDTARFPDGRTFPGKKLLKMTSFIKYSNDATDFGNPSTGQEVFNYQKGLTRSGQLILDPAGNPSTFMFPGNPSLPASATNWIETDPPGDRRFMMTAGPFTMAPGDTQEILAASLIAQSVSYTASVQALKEADSLVQRTYELGGTILPVDVSVTWPSGTTAMVSVVADTRYVNADSLSVALRRQDGTLVAELLLFDDGLHGDSSGADGIWGNSVSVAREPHGMKLDLLYRDPLNRYVSLDGLVNFITTTGPLNVRNFQVFSDNLNNNGEPNPGEDVRYGFTLVNPGEYNFNGVFVRPRFEPSNKTRMLDTLRAGAVDSMIYVPDDQGSYFSLVIPQNHSDTLFHLPIVITDTDFNRWAVTLAFRVYTVGDSVQTIQLNRVGGLGTGEFRIVTVYPSQLRDHLYVIRGVEDIDGAGTPGFTLRDSTDGRFILINHLLPDSLGHTVPVTDGFKVLLGTIELRGRMGDWSIPSGARRWTWVNADGFGLEGFNGAMGNAREHWFSGSTVGGAQIHHVLIRLAATDSGGNLVNPLDTTASLGYRYLRAANLPPAQPEFAPFILNPSSGYAYQEYGRASGPNIPFSAYDIDRGGRRMAVGHLESNVVGGTVDGLYWPPYSNSGVNTFVPREWWFIYDVPYATVPDPLLMVDIRSVTTPMMWMGTPNRLGDNIPFQAGDEFLIIANRPPSSAEAWTFNPTIIASVDDGEVPFSFQLLQNYPNPFNPSTTIRYSLPATSLAVLNIYNILGQRIRSLVGGEQAAGEHLEVWDGTNEAGRPVATGVYFYKLEARTGDRREYTMVKKMLLLR